MEQNGDVPPPTADDESMMEHYLLELKTRPAFTAAPLPGFPDLSRDAALASLARSGLPPLALTSLNYAPTMSPFLLHPGARAGFEMPFRIDTTATATSSSSSASSASSTPAGSSSGPGDRSPTHSTIDSPLEMPFAHFGTSMTLPALYNVYGGAPYPAYFPMAGMHPLFMPGLGLHPTDPTQFSNANTIRPEPLSSNSAQVPPPGQVHPSKSSLASPPKRLEEDAKQRLKEKSIIFVQDKDGDSSKNFRCPVEGCLRTYKYKGDLKTHVQNLHSDMPDLPDIISPPKKSKEGKRFPCPIDTCPSGFKSKRDLGRHLRHKHPTYTPVEKEFITYWRE